MIQSVEDRNEFARSAGGCVSTGWREVDDFLAAPAKADAGLRLGAIHEWFSMACDVGRGRRGCWSPPLCILTHLACQAVELGRPDQYVVWIARRCWPAPWMLARRGGLLGRSLLVDPPDVDGRLWAIDVALRCPAVCAVVADGSGLDMAATRRLQLSAKVRSCLGLLGRPAWEQDQLSAAASRWLVKPRVSSNDRPGWTVELLRCKGSQPVIERPRWALEFNRAQSAVVVSSELVGGADGQAQETAPCIKQRRA